MNTTRENELQRYKNEIAQKLIALRVSAGFTSPFKVSQETDKGNDAIYKLEKGLCIPSRSTLQILYRVYRMNDKEFKDIEQIVAKANKLQKEIRVECRKGIITR